jgi:glycosyltransferase involved in cell wall biosynthesis
LLEAVKKLRLPLRKEVAVLFLGEGHLRESLQGLAESQPAITVRFAGFQNQRSLSRFYNAADMLVMPSRVSETWGLVVNEALHHGLPCVVSNTVGAARDLVEEGVTGVTFEAASACDLSRAITRAVDLLGMPELRVRCRERVSGYSIDAAARGIARAYWEVADPDVRSEAVG